MKAPELVVVGLDGAVDAYAAEKAEKGAAAPWEALPEWTWARKRAAQTT